MFEAGNKYWFFLHKDGKKMFFPYDEWGDLDFASGTPAKEGDMTFKDAVAKRSHLIEAIELRCWGTRYNINEEKGIVAETWLFEGDAGDLYLCINIPLIGRTRIDAILHGDRETLLGSGILSIWENLPTEV